MSRRRFPLLAATLALPLLAAATCGDNLPGTSVAEYLTLRRAASCDRLVRCGVFTDVDTCVAFYRIEVDEDLVGATANGSIRFSEPDVPACLELIASASCNESLRDGRDPLACGGLFTGTLDEAEACVIGEQCKSGACTFSVCAEGTCCMGTCAAQETTTLADVGGACARDTECAYGAGCIGAGIQPGTCRALPLLGEACPYRRCAEVGARCEMNICVPDGPGATCATDQDCSEFNVCGTDGKCAAVPALGEACAGACAGDAYCVSGTCTAPQPNGTPCMAAGDCESEFCQEGAFFDTCATPESCF